jgi:mannitol/fructose-specific phosphotransferase system IIA component (Ntr-type)
MLEAVTTRENHMNTAVAPGVAMPHGYCHTLKGIVGVIGISRAGNENDTEEREAVHCIFMVLMGHECREKHLSVLSKLLHLLDPQVISEMQAAKSSQDVHDILRRFEQTDMRGLL